MIKQIEGETEKSERGTERDGEGVEWEMRHRGGGEGGEGE